MKDNRIFKAREVLPNRAEGWIVDLSPSDIVNPDCYWWFKTRLAAQEFLTLVDGGMNPREAEYRVHHFQP